MAAKNVKADSSEQEDPLSKKIVGQRSGLSEKAQPSAEQSAGSGAVPGNALPRIIRGMQRAVPIVLCYLPVSFAFGVLAVKAGMSAFEALAMGMMVYAGSGQLIAVGLLAAGAGTANIIFTTFVVNLRHLLMSAAVSPYLAKWPRLSQALFAYEMTDETFAVHISHFGRETKKDTSFVPDQTEIFAMNLTAHASWFGGGFVGALFGDVLGDVKPYGFDFALAGMFISLVVPHFANARLRIVAIIAGLSSIAFLLYGEKQWNVMLATVVAATIGAFIPEPKNESGSNGSGSGELKPQQSGYSPASESIPGKAVVNQTGPASQDHGNVRLEAVNQASISAGAVRC